MTVKSVGSRCRSRSQKFTTVKTTVAVGPIGLAAWLAATPANTRVVDLHGRALDQTQLGPTRAAPSLQIKPPPALQAPTSERRRGGSGRVRCQGGPWVGLDAPVLVLAVLRDPVTSVRSGRGAAEGAEPQPVVKATRLRYFGCGSCRPARTPRRRRGRSIPSSPGMVCQPPTASMSQITKASAVDGDLTRRQVPFTPPDGRGGTGRMLGTGHTCLVLAMASRPQPIQRGRHAHQWIARGLHLTAFPTPLVTSAVDRGAGVPVLANRPLQHLEEQGEEPRFLC